MVAIKKNSNEESYFVGAAKHKKKAGKKAASKSDALKIPLAVAERFLELKVDLPINMAAIPIALDKLADRKQFFISNQTKVTEENKKKAEEKIAKLMAELDADEKIAQESS
ncbi:multicopy suppressor of BFA (Brefeldin A) [Linderina pennispora]|nr:multicopy suppressor of BFA (Brefeldin A) [Linderina pennispora]